MEINTFMLIVFAPFVLGGVGLLVYGLRQRNKAKAAGTWPTTNASLVSAQVERHAYKSKYGPNVWYNPKIEYSYSVGGTGFSSHQISFGNPSFNTKEGAESFLRQFTSDNSIPIHYDPADPKNAVLVAGQAPHSLGFTLAGVALIVIPVLLAVYLMTLS